jgi:Nucleotidyl transferase AbiEii toxin, Type IV TA system
MSYESARALRTALEQRLKNQATKAGNLDAALDFADAHPVEIPVLRLEQHLAEKTHAYTRRYGPAAIPSSRVKDLVDIALVAATLELEAGGHWSPSSRSWENR